MAAPADPSRALAKMLGKLDEEDKDTLNWLLRGALALAPLPAPAKKSVWLARLPTPEEVVTGKDFCSWWRWRIKPDAPWRARLLGYTGGAIHEMGSTGCWVQLTHATYGEWCRIEDPE